jgi:hypothetical protein
LAGRKTGGIHARKKETRFIAGTTHDEEKKLREDTHAKKAKESVLLRAAG